MTKITAFDRLIQGRQDNSIPNYWNCSISTPSILLYGGVSLDCSESSTSNNYNQYRVISVFYTTATYTLPSIIPFLATPYCYFLSSNNSLYPLLLFYITYIAIISSAIFNFAVHL